MILFQKSSYFIFYFIFILESEIIRHQIYAYDDSIYAVRRFLPMQFINIFFSSHTCPFFMCESTFKFFFLSKFQFYNTVCYQLWSSCFIIHQNFTVGGGVERRNNSVSSSKCPLEGRQLESSSSHSFREQGKSKVQKLVWNFM